MGNKRGRPKKNKLEGQQSIQPQEKKEEKDATA